MASYLYLMPMLGSSDVPRYPIDERRQLIGRMEGADIPLFEPTVSRRHASIQIADGDVLLEDLSSKHGTYVNSRRINQAQLRVGDIIVIGLTLVLRLEEASQPLPSADRPPARVDATASTGHLDEHYVTAVRDAEARRLEHRLREAKTNQRGAPPPLGAGDVSAADMSLVQAEAAALCVSLLPEARARLLELRRGLKQLVDSGKQLADPYPFLSSADSVLETVDSIIAASQRAAAGDEPTTELGRAVQRTLGQLLEELPGTAFLVQIPAVCAIPVDSSVLDETLYLLLAHVSRWSCEGAPVEVMATPAHDHTVLTISYICRTSLEASEEHKRAVAVAELRDAVENVHGTFAEEQRSDGRDLVVTLPVVPP